MICHPSFTRTESITTPIAIYANFWRRALATAVDLFLIVVLSVGIGALFATPEDPLFDAVLNVAALMGLWLGVAWFESSAWQATPGKRLLGLQVTDERGNRISFLRAIGRNLVKLTGGSYSLAYLMALTSPRCQALHDRFQNTLVTRRLRRS